MELSIGEFGRRSRLSAKALRLYDELGLLRPARVDPGSGYRFYQPAQLEQARLVAALRQLRMPLATITTVIGLDDADAPAAIARFWAEDEAEHAARRDLARYIVHRLEGRDISMYEVTVREVPARSLLTMKGEVDGPEGAWAFGKRFVGLMSDRQMPRVPGRAGAAFCIYWGEVSEDGNGPIEWCRPVPADQAAALADGVPELTLRTEPAHQEACVDLSAALSVGPAQWRLASESLHAWADEHQAHPSDLGIRVTYQAGVRTTEANTPDCDVAVPIG
ncbi:MAG: MerR family transcriptional regulator [Streptosporangiaceae bacterium]